MSTAEPRPPAPGRSAIDQIAERVITSADAEHPADRVLREQLKAERSLPAQDAREVSRTVFAYYRWFGWLDGGDSLRTRLNRARELDDRFRRDPKSFPDDELVERAVPPWISSEMRVQPVWARTLQAEPAVWLRSKSGCTKDVTRVLGDCRSLGEGPLANTLEYRGDKDLFRTVAFHAGSFEIQDVSSQVVSLLCAPAPGDTWWDACAGEGGKLLHLSDLMQNKGLIWATDRAEWRLRQLKRRAARAGVFNYRAATWDGDPKRPTKTCFDGILVDAPCSGVGTWQRNPHARWTLKPSDITELADLQFSILDNAAPALKPGGKLVYAVCTLCRRETAEVVERFTRSHPKLRPLDMRNPLTGKTCVNGQCVLTPSETRGNGMFVAGWKLDLEQSPV